MSHRPAALRHRGGVAVALLLALTLALSGGLPASAIAAPPRRASYNQVINELMCTVCHESLALAQSPEAFQERQVVRTMVAQGETHRQIEHNMVESYGPAVLALPPAHGFNLFVYVIPPVLLALGVATLIITLPKWRRRTRLAGAQPTAAPRTLDPDDARRLNEDLARGA
ncbi:MAG: cytochrome c-type biogenesis protein [Solirubrobacteraceae bacterium]